MITLTAQMRIQGENPLPFTIGVSELGGGALFGETIDEEVKFDRRNLLSLESEVKDRADIDKPSFGIISTGGSLSFKDNSSRFLNYANAGLLTEGIEIKIFLENTVKKTKKQVGQYYTTDWNYDNDSRSVSVSFKDDLEEWQEVSVGLELVGSRSKNAFSLYEYLKEKTPLKFNFKEDFLSKDHLKKIGIDFLYLENGTLWSQWKKLCEIAMLFIYKDNYGDVVVCSSFIQGG